MCLTKMESGLTPPKWRHWSSCQLPRISRMWGKWWDAWIITEGSSKISARSVSQLTSCWKRICHLNGLNSDRKPWTHSRQHYLKMLCCTRRTQTSHSLCVWMHQDLLLAVLYLRKVMTTLRGRACLCQRHWMSARSSIIQMIRRHWHWWRA